MSWRKGAVILLWTVLLAGAPAGCRQGACVFDTRTQPDRAAPADLASPDVAEPAPYLLEQEGDGFRYVQGGVVLFLTALPFSLSVYSEADLVLGSADGQSPAPFSAAEMVQSGESLRLDTLALLEDDGQSATFLLSADGHEERLQLTLSSAGDGIVDIALEPEGEFPDSFGFTFSLASGKHWYGFGQWSDLSHGVVEEKRFPQPFLLDTGTYVNEQLMTREGSNVISPFWLTATAVGVFADSHACLGISWNEDDNGLFRLHRVRKWGADEPLKLSLVVGKHTRDAYEKWVSHSWTVRPDLPVGARPPDVDFEKAIWTTWAQFKTAINQEKVLSFAKEIADHGYDASYIEIDDRWTPYYGDLDFDKKTFPDAGQMVQQIHDLGFLVSAWVPPFVIIEAKNYSEGTKAQAFLASESSDYPALIGWWATAFIPISAGLDFTGESGRQWWGKKVEYVVDKYGVDAFKYDAGEAQFLPHDVILAEGVHPNSYPDWYARWGHEHHAAEMRAGWFSQDVPVAFRQFDKDSIWGTDNGLAGVLTQYLAMGLIGYPFILPDMVGGNEYLQKADDELFVRWVALNTFLPMVQFSVVPWRESFSPEVNEMTLALMEKRKSVTAYILQLADEAAATQMPLVRPLFFEFPEDEQAYEIEDQFMLGSEILVAPVLVQGAVSRDVYLPEGTWIGFDDEAQVHQGPTTLSGYPAPLGSVPAFHRVIE